MAVHIFVSEDFGCFPVGDDLFRIVLADFVKLFFADFAGGDIVIIPVGVSVPGKILALSVNRSVSVPEPDLIRDDAKIIILAFVHRLIIALSVQR